MVNCPVCGHEVDWVTLDQASRLLGVTVGRTSQLIKQGRLPGSVKHKPNSAMQPFWKVPIDSLTALINSRRFEQGLEPL